MSTELTITHLNQKTLGRAWVEKYWSDALLLVFSMTSFILFYSSHYWLLLGNGVNGPVATLISGTVEKRSTGSFAFYRVPSKTSFFNMDSVWVPEGQSAELSLENGDPLHLGEKTLIVFKRPFKVKGHVDQALRSIILAQGSIQNVKKIKAKNTKELDGIPPADIPMSSEKEQALLRADVSPKHRIRIYDKDRQGDHLTDIGFAWAAKNTESLIIRNLSDQSIQRLAVAGKSSLSLRLSLGSKYNWQLMDEKNEVVEGPFSFELNELNEELFKKLLLQPQNSRILIRWQ